MTLTRLLAMPALLAAVTSAACSQEGKALEIQPGSEVTLQKKDGVQVVGRLVEVKPEHVVVERRDGAKTSVARADIASLRADTSAVTNDRTASPTPATAVEAEGTAARADKATADGSKPAADPARANPSTKMFARAPEYREVTIPAGTLLPLELTTAVASGSSSVEDPVRATLRQPIIVDGVQALPARSVVVGHVTAAERAAKVKGRARVAFRFTSVDRPGDAERVTIRTDAVSRLAPATKKEDATKIGGGAAGGAIIGGILGGGDGAAKGAAIGGAAGTGVVLSTRGKEVRLDPGTDLSVRLAAPVTVRVPLK